MLAATDLEKLEHGRTVINLKPSDKVVNAFSPNASWFAVANDGQVLHSKTEDVSEQGVGAGGVAGMKLKGNAKIVVAGSGAGVSIATSLGAINLSGDAVPVKGRGGMGVRGFNPKKGETFKSAYIIPVGVEFNSDKQGGPANSTPVQGKPRK